MTKKDYDKSYHRTKNGIVTRLHGGQVARSKVRKHKPPGYSAEELKSWMFKQHLFHDLYDLWVMSGFDKNQKPSIDRRDDYVGYEFSNIRICTWRENLDKAGLDRTSGKNSKWNKPVIQKNVDNTVVEKFRSIKEASLKTGVDESAITKAAKGKRNSAGGFLWYYL